MTKYNLNLIIYSPRACLEHKNETVDWNARGKEGDAKSGALIPDFITFLAGSLDNVKPLVKYLI